MNILIICLTGLIDITRFMCISVNSDLMPFFQFPFNHLRHLFHLLPDQKKRRRNIMLFQNIQILLCQTAWSVIKGQIDYRL